MFTHPAGYVLLAAALVCLALTFVVAQEWALPGLAFAVAAGWFERDYPSGL